MPIYAAFFCKPWIAWPNTSMAIGRRGGTRSPEAAPSMMTSSNCTPRKGSTPTSSCMNFPAASAAAGAYLVDVGQHQMWAAQSIEVAPGQRWLTSGGMGSMGFALPAAIGAVTAVDSRPVVVIAGDGGFQCNLQELQTIIRNKMPVKIVVMNNRAHGMVRQFSAELLQRAVSIHRGRLRRSGLCTGSRGVRHLRPAPAE